MLTTTSINERGSETGLATSSVRADRFPWDGPPSLYQRERKILASNTTVRLLQARNRYALNRFAGTAATAESGVPYSFD